MRTPTFLGAMQQMTRLAVVERTIADQRLNARHPGRYSAKHISPIAKSMMAFKFDVPVLVDSSVKAVAGHAQILACQESGWTTVCLTHLSEAQTVFLSHFHTPLMFIGDVL